MAKIIRGDKEIEVIDGSSIIEVCDSLGVPFACYVGSCGICNINILEGEDNLGDLTDEEMKMGMNKKSRLACQCRIKKGIVKMIPLK